MNKTLLDRIELWLCVFGAGGALGVAVMQTGNALGPDADEILKGLAAGAFLSFLLAISSVVAGTRHSALGFVLRFTSAFMLMVFSCLNRALRTGWTSLQA